MKLQTKEFGTAREAIAYARAQRRKGLAAVLLDGKPAVIHVADAARLESAGVEFAYLSTAKGKVVTVPVN